MRVLFYEFNKIFFKQKSLIFILLFILIKLIVLFSTASYSVETTEENKSMYKNYLVNVEGKLTAKKESYIKDEKEKIDNVNSEKNQVVSDYLTGKINDNEYILKLNKVDDKLKNSDAFKIIYDQYKYVKQDSNNRYFLYTIGWTNLLGRENFDIILILLILLIVTPIFTYEYEKEMIYLILVSRKGKRATPAYKILAASIITIILTTIFSIIEYGYCALKYGLPSGNFPLQSIVFFKTSKYNLSLMQTYLFISVIKVIGFLAFTYLIICVSVITRKTVVTLFTSLSIILIPYFLYFNDSVKYKLPLPLGFIIGNGYFRGSDTSSQLVGRVMGFIQISKGEFIFQFIYMLILSVVCIIVSISLFSKFQYYRRKKI